MSSIAPEQRRDDLARRRVVGKAEVLEKGENLRSIETSFDKSEWEARALYEVLYCARAVRWRTGSWVSLATACPYTALFAIVFDRLGRAPPG